MHVEKQGWAGRAVPVIVILTLVSAVLLSMLYVILQRQVERMQRIDAETLQTVEARAAVADLLQVHLDLATAQRGYGLLGEEQYRQAFFRHVRRVQPAMERVLTEGAPLPGVRDVLPALAKASEDRVAFSRMIVGQVEAGRGAFARAEMISGRGSAVMGRLRTLIGNMDATMGNQLANAKARKADAKADIDRTLQAMLVLLGVTVTASAIAGILTIRGQATRLERQENLSNAIIDPILVLDSAGTILFANRATQQQFGYTSEELHGASADVLLAEWPHGEQVALGLGRLHPVDVQTGIVRDFLFRRRNGTRFRGNVSVGIAEEDGAPRFIAVVRPHLSLPASTQAGKAPGKANATPTTAFVLDLLGSLRARIVSADTPGAQPSHAGQVDKH